MANSLSKLSLCMELGDRLPPESELVRWLGEPIKTLLIPTSLFLTNKKGYPVLPKPYQVGTVRYPSSYCLDQCFGSAFGDQ
jgi:protein arginine N-methyltransferase 5